MTNTQVGEQTDIDKLEETKELYNSKYHGYFKNKTDKLSIFKHLKVEKPTKWFLNLISENMSQDSPTAKLTKTGRKYRKFSEREKNGRTQKNMVKSTITRKN